MSKKNFANTRKKIFILGLFSVVAFYVLWKRVRVAKFEFVEDLNTLSIETPSMQQRVTRKLKLANGVEVMIVSDPNADHSAASMAVGVGSWHDPKNRPGMAHFCEHLLFMGSKTYPKESNFSTSVYNHGGIYNAYTTAKSTVYAFSVSHSAFKDLLHQFSRFFIDPSFNPSSIGRELHAVDQESAMHIQNDIARYIMVLKETGNPDHPDALFDRGNSDTLKNIPVEEVKQWYETHYRQAPMRLVIYTKASMEEILPVVVDYFTPVPFCKKVTDPLYEGSISSAQQKGHITYVEPVRNIGSIALTWEFPDQYTLANHHIAKLISHVINSKEENSLCSQLKKEGLLNKMHAISYRIGDRLFFTIAIGFLPTDESLPIEKVITRCFQYIKMLQQDGIPQYIFEELTQEVKRSYAYQERINPYSFVMQAAGELLFEALNTYPLKTKLSSDYQASACADMLALLTPQSCSFGVLAHKKDTGVVCDREEQWYKAKYTVQPISEEKLLAWQEIAPDRNMGLPRENPYIPTDFTLKNKLGDIQAPIPSPIVLEENAKGKVFFYGDDRYGTPMISWKFQIKSPLITNDPKQFMLIRLYFACLEENFEKEIQNAFIMGLNTYFSATGEAFNILLQGYHDKAPVLLDRILSYLAKNRPSKEQFLKHRDILISQYSDKIQKTDPMQKAYDIYIETLLDKPTNSAYLAALSEISYELFDDFSQTLFETAYVNALFLGNLSAQEALDNFHKVQENLIKVPYPIGNHCKKKLFVLKPGEGPYKIVKKTPMKSHAAIMVLQVGDFSFEKESAGDILSQAWKTDYFDRLRTKQQVAYALDSDFFYHANQLMHVLMIRSSTHPYQELLVRTEAFIESYVKDFATHLPKERFEKIRQGLIENLRFQPHSLYDMFTRLDTLLFSWDGDFDHINKQIEALEKITYEEVEAYAKAFVSRQRRERIAFLVEGEALEGKVFVYEEIDSNCIGAKGDFIEKSDRKTH